ncbi:MAG: hypothetical protein CME64_06535 [Halobacteriovoraceae bacterium]|nr:hypothetical protein [Halobacteriovoraceae bacterium]|tara:strand:+ start:44322 stop:44819 length:498 start_codon:yes stop_codon:yes gene_type:complete
MQNFRTKSLVEAGILAGAFGGACMAIVANLGAFYLESDFWGPMKNVSAIFLGDGAQQGSIGVILVGIATHFLFSIVWGIVFAFLTKRVTSSSSEVVAGIIFGGAVWAIMTYLFLPVVSPEVIVAREGMEGWWFGCHLVFGFGLGITAPLKRNLEREVAPRRRVAH